MRSAFVTAWFFALPSTSCNTHCAWPPGVMIPELSAALNLTALGVRSVSGIYYGYSTLSIVAGASLDRFGAKYTIPTRRVPRTSWYLPSAP